MGNVEEQFEVATVEFKGGHVDGVLDCCLTGSLAKEKERNYSCDPDMGRWSTAGGSQADSGCSKSIFSMMSGTNHSHPLIYWRGLNL